MLTIGTILSVMHSLEHRCVPVYCVVPCTVSCILRHVGYGTHANQHLAHMSGMGILLAIVSCDHDKSCFGVVSSFVEQLCGFYRTYQENDE